MMAKLFTRGRVLFVVLGLAAAACGPRTRAAAPASPQREGAAVDTEAVGERDADEDDEADGALDDVDGGAEAPGIAGGDDAPSPCPTNMVLVANGELRFCIDKYEASLVEVDSEGNEKPYPHWLPVDGHAVRAVSQPDVYPQGFISEVQAEDACAASGKRLCSHSEWKTACMGPAKTTFPYGDARRPGACHDTGRSAVAAVFGLRAMTDPVASAPTKKPGTTKPASSAKKPAVADASRGKTSKRSDAPSATKGKPGRQAHASSTKGRAAETTRPRATRPGAPKATEKAMARAAKPARKNDDQKKKSAARSAKRVPAKTSTRPASVEPSVWTQLNDPRLGQVEGALSKTGSHDACVNDYGVFDMVGNLHEWVRNAPSAPNGTFAGGYYLDTAINGDGCLYRTTAHAHDYHDYSTGFRCCAEAEPAATTSD